MIKKKWLHNEPKLRVKKKKKTHKETITSNTIFKASYSSENVLPSLYMTGLLHVLLMTVSSPLGKS